MDKQWKVIEFTWKQLAVFTDEYSKVMFQMLMQQGDYRESIKVIVIQNVQMTIAVGSEHASQLDIMKSNNVVIEMAIADFFHYKSIPYQALWSSHF